jgi:hypothetical protein
MKIVYISIGLEMLHYKLEPFQGVPATVELEL